MKKPLREWVLEYDSNYDDVPPVVTCGPDISPEENEVHVREVSPEMDKAVEQIIEYLKKQTHERSCAQFMFGEDEYECDCILQEVTNLIAFFNEAKAKGAR